ncbi:diguanylate cyclase [Pseudoflavonifractor sp. BIOML-A6]|nr:MULTISPECIES: sensor domain-containing diguanylate cyclase [unclassified Pseudoflavonifractor]MTQ98251.1 diguanylate cyclase [Pseudoflavonifractor sp. BIOML-A16]MTR07769.1 diguanylate cyclase [Pseudoflavonifractor sp. BIOML-A15]MTR33992.1 diguanylate cyclase [Pseudoflavonifractor sp. BIOML-A14]MTR74743.1 diguanylate cyclase [Pseudoflavonifractor sp. BIOML-A18]MTS65766.1 diguanylate cyclase [Pseudoflavonifractor sp. BIOML-A5]MTS73060.1 diguanylate cyclase [Pseudoflavonifractor sp. BIOML-A8]
MKKNILMQTNLLVCLVIVVGFLLTAALSYRANYSASLENIEQVSDLTSEGIYYQMSTTFTKPVNISLTMANDSLLHETLAQEADRLDDPAYIETIREYLHTYQNKYRYDSVFLVSAASARYYNFNGLDRVLEPGDPENFWYFDDLLSSDAEYTMNVDNDQVAGADNAITVFVNCKIKNGDGTLLGVVGVGVRIDGLQRTLQDYQNQFGVNAYLIDDAGTIELSTDYSGYERVNLFELEAEYGGEERRDVLAWKEGDRALSLWSLDEAGRKRDYIVARYLPEIRWHLVVERDTSELVAELSRQILVTAVVIAVILAAILFIITTVIRRFNRRIVELTQSMEQERQAVFEKVTEELFENIYEIDVTRDLPANPATAAYFESLGAPPGCPYERALHYVAEKQIQEAFRRGYIETFSPANIMRTYESGSDSLTYELMLTRDGAHYYWMRITGRIVKWETDGSIHMLVYRQNIDAEKRQEQKMQELAWTDEMTGLLTKTATRRRVDELLAAHPGEDFAYFIFDIDNFKQANDLYGHAFGDSVICAFAGTIQAHFRRGDVLGRIGGDEFVAFARDTGAAAAAEKARGLNAALNRTHTRSGVGWQVSASIGVALAPGHGADADALYRHADAALYRAKARGKNGFAVYGGEDG